MSVTRVPPGERDQPVQRAGILEKDPFVSLDPDGVGEEPDRERPCEQGQDRGGWGRGRGNAKGPNEASQYNAG